MNPVDDFDLLLEWLDPDRELAAMKYEEIRRRLTRFFYCRGCGVDSEELVDETIQRVTGRVQDLSGSYIGEPVRYFYGVARNVFREWLKEQLEKNNFEPPPSGDSTEEKERMDDCLQRCLERDKDASAIILDYYIGEKKVKIERRKKMAKDLGIGPNALRIKAHRIRVALRNCVENCLESDVDEGKPNETESRNGH